MDKSERYHRLQELLNKNKNRIDSELPIEFKECLEELGDDITILSNENSKKIYKDFQTMLPFEWWGRIKWNEISIKYKINNYNNIIHLLRQQKRLNDNLIYILWGTGPYPVLSCNLNKILQHVDIINSIGFDQWIYCPADRYVIEFYHEGEITLGIYS